MLARCSQPEVGWLGWRSPEDEQLLKAIADACAYDRLHNVTLETPVVTSVSFTHTGLDTQNQAFVPGSLVSSNGSVQTATMSSTMTAPAMLNGGNDSSQLDSNGSSSSGASSLKDSLPDEVDLPPQGKVCCYCQLNFVFLFSSRTSF